MLAKSDVDLDRGTITVARSHDRDTTNGGAAAVLPLPAPLRPWIEYQVKHAPGPLLFPAPDGSQRRREADPQKILRNALSRAGIAKGWEHRCRWCGHKERHQDREQRYCPSCLTRTDGTGKPAKHIRGRLLWPKALPLKMRFHDLRHTFATELLRQASTCTVCSGSCGTATCASQPERTHTCSSRTCAPRSMRTPRSRLCRRPLNEPPFAAILLHEGPDPKRTNLARARTTCRR